jgi:hypothetical protein
VESSQRRNTQKESRFSRACRRTLRRKTRVMPAASGLAEKVAAETLPREPTRCVFGATRVGALLGRLRLHLQTDRFLASHRRDEVWEAGCGDATDAVERLITQMPARKRDAWLASRRSPSSGSVRRSSSRSFRRALSRAARGRERTVVASQSGVRETR